MLRCLLLCELFHNFSGRFLLANSLEELLPASVEGNVLQAIDYKHGAEATADKLVSTLRLAVKL
jgi:hypothetical protein